MPIRRPGTAGSAVAAMASGQGSRSSRPGLEKPRNEKRKAWEGRGEYGDAHHGEKSERRRLGDGGSRGGGRRNPASSERRLLGPPVRERGRNWSGERERDAREGLGSFKLRPRSERRAHDARGVGAVAARPPLPVAGRAGGRWGEELTSGPGWQRLRARQRRAATAAWPSWAGSCGRAVLGRLGWRLV